MKVQMLFQYGLLYDAIPKYGPIMLTLLSMIAVGCQNRDYSSMIRLIESTQNDIAVVRDFKEMFPDSTHFVSYYTGQYGTPTWNSVAPLHKRYELTMQMKITISKDGTRVLDHQEPHFYLVEIRDIRRRNDEGWSLDVRDIADFGIEKWMTLSEHKGDFEKIGIRLNQDCPVDGFDQHWESKL